MSLHPSLGTQLIIPPARQICPGKTPQLSNLWARRGVPRGGGRQGSPAGTEQGIPHVRIPSLVNRAIMAVAWRRAQETFPSVSWSRGGQGGPLPAPAPATPAVPSSLGQGVPGVSPQPGWFQVLISPPGREDRDCEPPSEGGWGYEWRYHRQTPLKGPHKQ